MPRLAVVYDEGSVTAGEIAVGLSKLGTVAFAVVESEHTNEHLPLLRELGEVLAPDAAALRAFGPDAVLTFSERQLRATAELTAELGLPGHDPETARLVTDKAAQRRRLRESGVDAVLVHELTTPGDWRDAAAWLPLVLKPARGEGSRDTVMVTDEPAGQRFVAGWFDRRPGECLLAEEFLRGRASAPFGDYVSVESAVAHGEVSTIAVTGKFPLIPPFRELGHLWPSHLGPAEEDAVVALASAAVRALGVRTGITHTEIKLTDAGPRIIEVNGRLGGLLNPLSTRAVGLDLVEVAGRLALGEQPKITPVRPDGVHFLYYNPAPPFPCRLDGIQGVRDLRALPGITAYQPFVRRGAELGGGVMTTRIDMICGRADNHDEMFAVLRKALETLVYTMSTPDGPVVASGLELPALVPSDGQQP